MSQNAETANDSLSPDSTVFPPPLESGEASELAPNNRSSRRVSGFWEILNPRRMEEASPQERIAALRRVHEQRRATNASEELETRRRRRLTARLGERFGISTRPRGVSPPASLESSAAATAAADTTAPTAPATSTGNTAAAENNNGPR